MEAPFSATVKLLSASSTELLSYPAATNIIKFIYSQCNVIQEITSAALRVVVVICMIISVVVFAEKVFVGMVSLYAKVFRWRPDKVYKWQPIEEDEELGSLAYPTVLVQIPMYNEREVYHLSIGAACKLKWPSDQLIIQILDDSTDPVIKDMVKEECKKWSINGLRIKYEARKERIGYKAGNLREGMKHGYVQTCEYIAIFDADFQPEPDFLMRTVPFLMQNPKIDLVQARWKFVNANACLLTRIQEISMDYHFKVEQEAGSTLCGFFGFNGTAGVWRSQVIRDAGGWDDRSTAEDMDLAIRAALLGSDFLYVGSIKAKSELPSTLKAYRSQQHRWSCGPAVLFKKMFWQILITKKVSIWKKFYIIINFFLARRFLAAFFFFFFFNVLLPVAVFFPEIKFPKWDVLFLPITLTVLTSVATPRSLHFMIMWIFFENVISLHRWKAILIGFFETGRSNEWIVTQKFGNKLKREPDSIAAHRVGFAERFHMLEIMFGMFLLLTAWFDYAFRNDNVFLFLIPQSISFFVVGFDCMGK